MNFIKFLVWLVAGAIIGWVASRMVDIENRQKPERVFPIDS